MFRPSTLPGRVALLSLALTLASLTMIPAVSLAASDDTEGATGVGIQLLDVSTYLQDDPRAKSYIVDNVEPGTTIVRGIRVRNDSTEATFVSVYAGAATISAGQFTAGEGREQNELATWITPAIESVELESGESEDIEVSIAVPADASEGEQYAAVWAEVTSDPETSGTVITVNRVGIRVYLSVAPGNGPAANFAINSFTAARDASGNPQLIATVTNTGGRAVDISGTVSLANGPSGLSAGPFTLTTATTLAPAESGQVTLVLDADLPNGPWDATVSLTSGLIVQSTTATITFPDAGTGGTVVVEEQPSNTLLIVGGVVLLLSLAFLTVAAIRHQARRKASEATTEALN
ncbi:MAG TPA: hypothetical protein VGP24_02555 [Glaciihabitans sp.]|nr:hypothetical protein [Glaciihabitans sp.]